MAAALALLASLPLPAAAIDTTAPAVATPVLSAATANQGVPVTVSTTATDPSGVTGTEVRIDSGAWTVMQPGLGANVTTSRNGVGLLNVGFAHVRAGTGFACGLMVGGTVRCWGDNGSGQLGNGTNTASRLPVAVSGIASAISLATGGAHACAVISGGGVRCWGANGSGQLGNGGTAASSTPVAVTGIATAVGIAAGANHTCAVLADKTVRCWGADNFAQLGDGGSSNKTTSVPVAGITTAIAVAAGESHSCAILGSGTIRCWGYNAQGQLGNGTTNPGTTPLAVSGITTATVITTGANHTCARLSTSTLRCWGDNHDGQLGDGTTTDRSAPVPVSGISTATTISAGFRHTCARLSTGVVKCWGENASGQLGDGDFAAKSSPVTVTSLGSASSISAGRGFTCARLADSTVRCWGDNGSGQLGNSPSTTVRTTSVQVAGISTATAIGSGEKHSCAILSGGSVKCWGSANTSFGATPVTIAGTGIVTAVGGGAYHTCALLADKTVRCWGGMVFGGIGNGTTGSGTPVAVTGLSTATAIGVGRYDACALLADKTVRCWGYNGKGQLGDGTTYDRFAPVTVYGLANVTAIAAGTWHTCAIVDPGAVKCWGSNTFGQLGDGTKNASSLPVAVSGISTATRLALGDSTSCALLQGGTVKCWGSNSYHELGQSNLSLVDSATPVAVPGVTTAMTVTSLVAHFCASLTDNTVRCWGDNGAGDFGPGQLGNGTTAPSDSPVSVLGIATATAVSVGGGHSCALILDHTVRCWGQGDEGELGVDLGSVGSNRLPLDGVIGTLSAGTHQVCVRATDSAGNVSAGTACATLTVVDKTGPTATAPAVTLRSGVSLTDTSLRVTYAWGGADNTGGTGINHYELAKSTDGGTTWASYVGTFTATSATASILPTGTVRIRVRATDNAGNVGAWAIGPVLTQKSIEESDAAITYSGTWAAGASASYSGGGSKYASAAGASAQHTFRGRSIALVSTTGPTRGAVKVYVDGALVKTVDTYSATGAYRVQVWAQGWTTVGTHTVKFVVAGTTGRARVDLDAIVVVGSETVPLTEPPVTGGGAPPPTSGGAPPPGTDAVAPFDAAGTPDGRLAFLIMLAVLMLGIRLPLGRRAANRAGRREG